jgi:hypothetical protein
MKFPSFPNSTLQRQPPSRSASDLTDFIVRLLADVDVPASPHFHLLRTQGWKGLGAPSPTEPESEWLGRLARQPAPSWRIGICRAEQLRSLRKGKCLIPVLGQKNTDIPLHLETKSYPDFTAPSTQEVRFKELLQDIRGRKGVKLN